MEDKPCTGHRQSACAFLRHDDKIKEETRIRREGKTKFVEGILSHFGMQEKISSPTFTIVNEYHNSQIDIYHFDLYRLGDIYEFENIGGEEYFHKGICIFEWGELIEDILPNDYIKISFEKDDENDEIRKLIIEPHGNRYNDVDFTQFSK